MQIWLKHTAWQIDCATNLKNFQICSMQGYTQDALKEFVEANVTCALIQKQRLQTPEETGR
jgi:predicted translin family RNA/ssDNA-binding protein